MSKSHIALKLTIYHNKIKHKNSSMYFPGIYINPFKQSVHPLHCFCSIKVKVKIIPIGIEIHKQNEYAPLDKLRACI